MKKLIILIILSCITLNSKAELILNGDFEVGPKTLPIFPLTIDSDLLYGWSIFGGTVEYSQFGNNWAIDLDASPGPGGISQDLSTKIGQQYELSFLWAGIPYGSPFIIEFRDGKFIQEDICSQSDQNCQTKTFI
jgi:hypothetical protein